MRMHKGFTWGKVRVQVRGLRKLTHSVRLDGQLELKLDILFKRAVALAEHHGRSQLRDDLEAWNGLKLLLPLIADAQSLLLETEKNRCKAVAERRGGRACAVRFRCFDLSALDTPQAHLTGSQKTEEDVLQALLRLMAAQRLWLANTSVR